MAEISGVRVSQIGKICDDRGSIMHMMRSDDTFFKGFGEIYFSTCYPGVVKGWHIHSKMTLNYVCLKGMIKLVMYDDRDNSDTKGNILEFCIGDKNYCIVQIPPNVWNGFMALGTEEAIIANLSDIPHDPDEIRRADPLGEEHKIYNNDQFIKTVVLKNIPYDWSVKWR